MVFLVEEVLIWAIDSLVLIGGVIVVVLISMINMDLTIISIFGDVKNADTKTAFPHQISMHQRKILNGMRMMMTISLYDPLKTIKRLSCRQPFWYNGHIENNTNAWCLHR